MKYIPIGSNPQPGNYTSDFNGNFASLFSGVLQYLRSDLGITQTGGNVTGWADQSGNGVNVTPSGGSSYIGTVTTGLNGHAGIASDGTTQGGQYVLDRPLPGTQPTFFWVVWRLLSLPVTSPARLLYDQNAWMGVFVNNGTTDVYCGETVAVGPVTAALGDWGIGQYGFSNSSSDVVAFGSQVVTGNAGNGFDPIGPRGIFCTNLGAGRINAEILCCITLNNIPTQTQLDNAKAAAISFYGTQILFPQTIQPAMWLNANQPMYQDLAGTVLANPGDPVGCVKEPFPLTQRWTANNLTERVQNDNGTAVRFEYGGGTYSQSLTYSGAVSASTTASTFAVSFMARDAVQSIQQDLFRYYSGSTGTFGLYATSGYMGITYNSGGANWTANTVTPVWKKGQRITAVFRLSPTGIKSTILIDGVTYNDSITTSVTGANTSGGSGWWIGYTAGADQGFYGSITNAMFINRTITDAETTQLANWCDLQQVSPGFPIDAPLFAVTGDSIARGNPGVNSYLVWGFNALYSIQNSTYPTAQLLNCAIGGSGSQPVSTYEPVIPYYSQVRKKNVLIIAAGTNDLANNNGTTFVLNNLFSAYDQALAAGWKVAIATIIDRTGSLSISQSNYDAQRLLVNNTLLASGRKIVDLTGVSEVSANGAANNTTYFIGDGIHPGNAGQVLMEPVYRAMMLSLAT